jgi:hypothetical protein
MLQPGFTHTAQGQPGGPAPGLGGNNDFAMQQVRLFTGGAIASHVGAFNPSYVRWCRPLLRLGQYGCPLYGTPTGGPNRTGWIGEIPYLPFSHGGPKVWPYLNFRIGLQYTRWSTFDGASSNVDGMGRSARANNTLFLYVWDDGLNALCVSPFSIARRRRSCPRTRSGAPRRTHQ